MTLFGNRVIADELVALSWLLRMGPQSNMTGLIRGKPCEDTVAGENHVIMKAEAGVIQPQAKEGQ